MIKPFTIGITKEETESKQSGIMPDFTKTIDSPAFTEPQIIVDDGKKKRGRPRKGQASSTDLFSSPSHMVQAGESFITTDDKRELSLMESTEPIEKKYAETNNILRSAIMQLDSSMAQVQEDIDYVRHAKTLRNKYQYLSLLQGSMGTMIANKISAARELNNTISKCNELEIKRFKEVKAANAASDQDDDQRVMEMYKAFVSTPVSQNAFPNVSQLAVSSPSNQVQTIGVDNGYEAYLQNLTPQQNQMYIEADPNIQQVVVYNQETGARYFDVIDMTTGQSIPNAEKHDVMFLEDTTIDLKNKVARNVNLGETYPLVVVGQPLMQEY